MADSLQNVVRQIMGDVFATDPSSIDEKWRMGTIEQWDSGNHIILVLALEEEFGVSFDVSEIDTMVSFMDVVSTLKSKL
jgi:acyl carrier protein